MPLNGVVVVAQLELAPGVEPLARARGLDDAVRGLLLLDAHLRAVAPRLDALTVPHLHEQPLACKRRQVGPLHVQPGGTWETPSSVKSKNAMHDSKFGPTFETS